MADNSVNCIVTSPPYNKKGLLGADRGTGKVWGNHNIDYDAYGDDMPEEDYQAWMVAVLNEMYRIIKPDGSIFFNHKPRRHENRAHLPIDFISRSDAELYQLIIWNRKMSPNIRNDILVPCTEHIYWLCKDKPKVFRKRMAAEFVGEVWTIIPEKQKNHPAPFPQQLVKNCLLLTTEEGDLVLDPFMGCGTTAQVCIYMNRNWTGFELSEYYIKEFTPSNTLF